MNVPPATVLRYRLAVNHLSGPRLARGSLATAAHSGLQDGSPRSALLSLDARVHGVETDDWRDPNLAQVFGPRGAIYVVPRSDLAVFTKGLLPRNRERITAIKAAADRIIDFLNGEPASQSAVLAGVPSLEGSRELRWAACLGNLVPVWDTVETVVHPTATPGDPEEARQELARRFFRYFGPATVKSLQWWLDGSLRDAQQTTDAIRDELVDVTVGDSHGYVLAEATPLLLSQPDPHPVMLLPPDDVAVSRLGRSDLDEPNQVKLQLWPKAPPPGALLIHGRVAGTWRRRQRHVTVHPLRAIGRRVHAEVERIVAEWPLPATSSATVTWTETG